MDWWEKPDEVMATIQELSPGKRIHEESAQMTATEINSTPTEVAALAPTAQITNNEISFVLKASPVAPESKQLPFFLAKPDRTKVQVCKDYPIQLFTGRLFLYGQLLYPPLPNTEDYGKRGANQ